MGTPSSSETETTLSRQLLQKQLSCRQNKLVHLRFFLSPVRSEDGFEQSHGVMVSGRSFRPPLNRRRWRGSRVIDVATMLLPG
jgi:hypothetical protein